MKPPLRLSRRAEALLDAFLLFALSVALIRPLFKAKYLDLWSSIESTFIADARFLIAHWPHPQWQPLWYLGTRFDYIYPPALRYGTAVISMVIGYWPVKAYHFYTAFFYCLGIAGVYAFVRTASGSRGQAFLGALATALVSPSFLLLADIRKDAFYLTPQRLSALVRYGEGPHITALSLIPFALAFAWRALETRRPGPVAGAAIFCAAVVSNNFYGATALAVFYAVLVWSLWITRPNFRMLLPAAAIPVLAYTLTAFWLVPSYFKITTINMQWVSQPGNKWSMAVGAGVAALFALATFRFAHKRPDRAWTVFVAGCLIAFGVNVLGQAYFNFRVYGEPLRLIPELDLVFIWAALLALAWVWKRGGKHGRIAAVVVTIGAFSPAVVYIRHAWQLFPRGPNYEDRIEYRISEWFWKNMPDARIYPIGSVRFWFDAWHDLAELGGGSEQGLLNPIVEPAQWELTQGPDPAPGVLWLECLGVDAVYVSDKRSEEIYKDFVYPNKFDGVLPVAYDDGKGNRIYRVPRRYPVRARVVETARLDATQPPRSNTDMEYMQAYADVIEHGPDSPPKLVRTSTDAMRIQARIGAGQSLVVQESYDPAWQASAGGRRLAIHKDAMGFLAIETPPGDLDIDLRFVTPLENRAGRWVTAAGMLTIAGLLALAVRRRTA